MQIYKFAQLTIKMTEPEAKFKAKYIRGQNYLELMGDVRTLAADDGLQDKIQFGECPKGMGDVYFSMPSELIPKLETIKKKWYIERV